MTKIKIPGLIDPHVHMRDPGATHKEDWHSGTTAALAGGFTIVLTMPNTAPPITSPEAFEIAVREAEKKACCDWGQFLGAGPDNAQEIAPLASQAAGLKMYLDSTYGELRLDEMQLWMSHFEHWPKEWPIAVHSEQRTMAAAILMAGMYDRPIHICHVSREEEILVIRKAKEKGIPVTCEVAPHHLFLTENDIPKIGQGRGEVRPILAHETDRQALWEHMEVIDVFATDHAPHTLEEKDSNTPPPGFPGLETALPLMLTAVHEGKLELQDITDRMHTNPRKIFNLPEQKDTFIEVDPDTAWQVKAEKLYSRCGWTPFEGWEMRGRVERVVLRGEEVYKEGQLLAPPRYRKNIRTNS